MKLHDDEHEDAEYSDEHNDDDEMMFTLPSVAQNGIYSYSQENQTTIFIEM